MEREKDSDLAHSVQRQKFCAEEIRETEFPQLKDNIYLDHAGASLYSLSHIKSYHQDLEENLYSNPHSQSQSSVDTTLMIENVRDKVLGLLNTDSSSYSLVFTAGCTAAIKLVGECFPWASPPSTPTSFYYLLDNHTSILGVRALATSQGAQVVCLTEAELISLLASPPPHSLKGLLAYPAQSNFSGRRYPLEAWCCGCDDVGLSCLLDAAALVSSSPLNLSRVQPDFVALSFYKMFGLPTGLGALVVKKSSEHLLSKKYYGGGTVRAVSSTRNYCVLRKDLSARFEDGTIPFLSILSLQHGLVSMERLCSSPVSAGGGGWMRDVDEHVFHVSSTCYQGMLGLSHPTTGKALCEIYCDTPFTSPQTQGGTIAFNVMSSQGHYIGYSQVQLLANLYKIHMRTGCFCNIGCCQKFLNLSTEDIESNLEAGHECGDMKDVISGRPTGCCRVSFGFYSTLEDVRKFLSFLGECFLCADEVPDASPCPPVTCNNSLGTLSNIFLYPVKSCGAMEVSSSWYVSSTGLLYDREWMLVEDKSGRLISQKRHPTVCLITPVVDADGTLHLHAPGMPPVTPSCSSTSLMSVSPAGTNSQCRTKLCGDEISCHLTSHISPWLRDALHLQSTDPAMVLARRVSRHHRRSKAAKKSLSLANQAQYLVVFRSDVCQVLHCLNSGFNVQLTYEDLVSRFRANLVINDNGHDCDDVAIQREMYKCRAVPKEFQVGEVTFKYQGPCNRCAVVCVQQSSGEICKQVLAAIRGQDGKLYFGHYYYTDLTGNDKMLKIRVGETVTAV